MRSGDRRTRYYGEAWRGGARPRPRRRDGRGRVAGCRTVVAFLLLFLCGAPPVRARQATPFLETDHWVHAALRRLNGLGLLGAGHDPGGRSITERRAERLLRSAVSAAAGTPYEEIARGYLDRFTEEFGEPWVRPADGGDALGLAGGVGLGVRAESGGLTAATGYRNTAGGTDPRPIPDRESVGPAARLRVYGGRYAAGQLVATTGREGAGIGDAYVLLTPASLGIWFGRRAVGFGPGAGGGVVLSADAFTGGGVAFLEDVTLPGFLRHLGPVRAETFLARVQGDETVRDPWFWAGRLSVQPHERLVIGVNRGAMVAGDEDYDLRLRDLLYVVIGKHAGRKSEVDNQIVAVDVWYRVPAGPVPLVLYGEWGFEDSAGAWKEAPGILAGVRLASVPGLPRLSVAVERTGFVPGKTRNLPWYRHWRFHQGWTVDGRPLGHPLAGSGTEWRVAGWADSPDARLRIRVDAFHRDRGELNLYAPDREGESVGGEVDVAVRVGPRVEVRVRGLHERGDGGWRETRVAASGQVRLW